METYLYLSVRIATACYLLYRLYVILFKKRLFGIWDRIPIRDRKIKGSKPRRQWEPVKNKVVGKTDNTYLPEPANSKAEPRPVMSLPLEASDYIGDDSDDDPPEFEVEDNRTERPSDDDLADPDDDRPPLDPELSTGVTYEEIMEAAGFMAAPTDDDDAMMRTAGTLVSVRNSDVFDFIQNEVCSKAAIERLFDECLDANGELLPRRRSKTVKVDITQYDFPKFI